MREGEAGSDAAWAEDDSDTKTQARGRQSGLTIMDAKLQSDRMPQTYAGAVAARPITAAAIAVAIGGAATILGAWFFQYVLGYMPCPLCLEQRYAYYFGIPLAVLVVLGESVGASRKVLLLALFAIMAGMIWNTGLSAFHAGVEWKWWPGPRDCSGPLDSLGSSGGLLRDLQSIHVARCDDAAWRFLGISLAGYDVLISATLAAIAGWGVLAGWKQGRAA
jgi:disulfide bond formation protein DsbB